MMNRNIVRYGVPVALVALCAVARLLPHLPNFTPIAAAALFAAYFTGRRTVGALVALGAMLVSDAFVGSYSTPMMITVYGALALPALVGPALRGKASALTVGASAIGAGLGFFALTNLAVWAFSGMYPQTIEGLGACYLSALPFLKYTLAGNVVWAGAFFGLHALATRQLPALQRA
ncbi:MAG: DUF6580 family putative transport protein [Bradymonadia bacterium]